VEAIAARKKPGSPPFIVDLHGNRFNLTNNVLDGLEKIIKCASVLFVDISVNPIASVDGKALFNKLAPDDRLLGKLIYIPEPWLAESNWMILFDTNSEEDEERIRKVVLQAHSAYYKQCI
jgi:hypothetical protein